MTPTTLPALRALVLPLASAHAREVLSRPWSAADRARTLRVAASPAAGAQELVCPGHIPVVTPLAEEVPTPAAAATSTATEAGGSPASNGETRGSASSTPEPSR